MPHGEKVQNVFSFYDPKNLMILVKFLVSQLILLNFMSKFMQNLDRSSLWCSNLSSRISRSFLLQSETSKSDVRYCLFLINISATEQAEHA